MLYDSSSSSSLDTSASKTIRVDELHENLEEKKKRWVAWNEHDTN